MVARQPFCTGHVDLAREWRGGQRQVYLLTTGLARRGHPTHVFTRPGTPLAQRLADTSVNVHELAAMGEWDVFAARRLARTVADSGIELLAAHASHPHGLALLARRFGLRVPVVVHRRVDVLVRGGFFNRRKYAAPERYIAIGEAVKKTLVDAGVPAAKVSVVSSGVPPHVAVAGAKQDLGAKLGIDPAALWVGDVASLVAHKGHRFLLEAWPRVRSAVDARLILVGDGELRAALERRAVELGVADSVHFVGWRDDVSAWLSAFDLFAMTSLTEGLCTAILDAMAAKIPVVATAAGGIPELVVAGETGVLAPVGDAVAIAAQIVRALEDREAAQARMQAAYERVWVPRSSERVVEGSLAIYRECVSNYGINTKHS